MKMRLSHRISLYIGTILLSGMGLMVYHYVLFHSRFFEEAGIAEARRMSNIVFDNLYAAMRLGGERIEGGDVIEGLKNIEGVREIRIIHGPSIDRQYGVEEDEMPVDGLDRRALRGESVSSISEDGEWMARFVMPVFVRQECIKCHNARVGEVNGAISVEVSLENYRTFISAITKRFLVLGGVVFFLTAASILFTVRKRFLNPIERLKKGAEALARGDFAYRADITSGDEMEEVGGAFDRMAQSLHDKTGELKGLSEKYAKLLTLAADAIVLHEVDTGRIVEVNPAVEVLTGYSREELLNRLDVYALYPPEKLYEYRLLLKRWLEDGKGYFFDALIRRKDGKAIPVEIAASVVELGGRVFMQEIWRDLAERKGFAEALKKYARGLEEKVKERTAELTIALSKSERYRNELEEAYRRLKESEKTLVQTVKMASLGEMGAGVAHELNSPLAGILSITEVMMKRVEKTSENYYFLEKIKDAAVRSKDIITNLLTYSMPSREKISLLSVNEVVRSTLTLFTSEVKTKSIEVREELAQGLPGVLGNRGQLMEVFLNIIKNSRDAMAGMETGVITVRTALAKIEGKEFVVAEIGDTGCGIPDEVKEKIFDPFFTTKEKGGGLNVGLGLSITRGIVNGHNGRIEFKSEKGEGTVFRVFLPVYKEG